MTTTYRSGTYISVSTAVCRSGLSRYELYQCIAHGLVVLPLHESDLLELRRIRRLQDLGVNMAGIEIILRMRDRIEALQDELDRRNRARSRPLRLRYNDPSQRLLPWYLDRDKRQNL